jgi:hypothetical protein
MDMLRWILLLVGVLVIAGPGACVLRVVVPGT